jgi:hypothetical protein
MEPEGSLSCSQEPTIGLCTEPQEYKYDLTGSDDGE